MYNFDWNIYLCMHYIIYSVILIFQTSKGNIGVKQQCSTTRKELLVRVIPMFKKNEGSRNPVSTVSHVC